MLKVINGSYEATQQMVVELFQIIIHAFSLRIGKVLIYIGMGQIEWGQCDDIEVGLLKY